MQQCTKLSKYHKDKIVPIVVKIFKANLGVISNRMIQDIVFDETGKPVDPSTIRAAIHEIRTKGLVKNIIANCQGYRVARNVQEAADYIAELQSRAMAIHDVQAALKKQAEEVFSHQLTLV